MTSKVEFYQLEKVDDDVFGQSTKDDNSKSLKTYSKLPSKNDLKDNDQLASNSGISESKQEDQSTDNQTGAKDITEASESNDNQKNEGLNIQKMLNQDNGRHTSQSNIEEEKGDQSHQASSKNTDSAIKIGEFEVKSEFSERLLKSIDVDKQWKYLKIICHENLNNKLNVFNQIGIINISFFGNIVGYENEYITGLKNINPSEAILIDMMLKKGKEKEAKPVKNVSLSVSDRLNPKPTPSSLNVFDDKITALSKSKIKAVEDEDYMEAEKLKQIILKIEKLKVYVDKLEKQKVDFANNEKYDSALKVKTEIDRIK